VNALLLGSLLHQSRLVPRLLPLLGFVGAALLVTSTTATLFGANEYGSGLSGIMALPIATWEFSLGIYLVVKGFRAEGLRKLGFAPEAETSATEAATTAPAPQSELRPAA
jgi:Na+/H+ antiporter NhaD/arsenite permease-like protein